MNPDFSLLEQNGIQGLVQLFREFGDDGASSDDVRVIIDSHLHPTAFIRLLVYANSVL
jgi:hypothetical protein